MQTTQNKKFHNQSHREVRTQPSLFCYAIFYSSFIIPYIFRFENFPIKQKTPQPKPEHHLFSILNYLKHLLRHRFLFLLFNLRLRFPKLFSHRRHFRQYHYQGRDKSFGYFYDLQNTASTPFRLPRSMKYSDVFPIHLLCHFPTGG